LTVPRKFRASSDHGSMAVEMALFLFFFSTLFLGTFEVPRYLLLGQKLERASATMSDLVAQIDPALGGEQEKIDDLFEAPQRFRAVS
jgi:Flp pilus assembly protein TadG